MARDNKSLGQFDLKDIPPAPRGGPQIAVAFDIDSSGIVTVSARDQATGKEHAITISSSGGLTSSDIEELIKAAEANAAADAARKEKAEAVNNLDSLIYTTRKTVDENADKIPDDLRQEVTSLMETSVIMSKDDDSTTEALKTAHSNLLNKSLKIGEYLHTVEKPVTES
jgi:molecular chaperone DnaK